MTCDFAHWDLCPISQCCKRDDTAQAGLPRLDAQGHADAIRRAIERALADGYTVEVQSKGYPDPDEEQLAVTHPDYPAAQAWHWRYDDDD